MIDPNIVIMNALGLGEFKLSTRVEVVLRAGQGRTCPSPCCTRRPERPTSGKGPCS